jgi:uncharacterized protein YkwD
VDSAAVSKLHARSVAALLALGIALSQAAPPASPDVLQAINAVRASGCSGRPGVTPPLRENPNLDDAARRSAKLSFQDALSAAGYRATRSLMIRISGAASVRSVAGFLERDYCAHVLDSAYAEIGIYQQLRETRIILAAPFMAPPAEAAEAVAVRVLQLVNSARERPRMCGGTRFAAARPLLLNDLLSRASLTHAADMAQYNYFSHEGRDGSSAADRLARAGYQWRAVGENIAAGPATPETVVDGWLRSPQHCANLMASQFREMGVAFAVNRASEAGIYWVQVFGVSR